MHINTHSKDFLTQRCRRSTDVHCVWYFCTYQYGLSLNGWHVLFCIANNRHGATITTHAIQHHFLIWMTTVRQPAKRRCSCVLTLKYTFICVYWWTSQRIHNTLIWVDRYLRLMGDKTIPDSAEPRLQSFYLPFVAGIDLPHQGVVDSYNLFHWYHYGGSHVGSHFSHQAIWPLNSEGSCLIAYYTNEMDMLRNSVISKLAFGQLVTENLARR